MSNAIRMDFYKMFKMKSFYVINFIMLIIIVVTAYLTASEFKSMEKSQQNYEFLEENMENEPMNIGISVEIPTRPGDKVTLLDILYANIQAKVLALFMVIFTVLFVMADMNNGYIKNIGGQVSNRSSLMLSKSVVLFFYTIQMTVIFFIIQLISNQIFFGYVKFGNIVLLIKYFGIQMVLHFALLMICMALALVIKHNVFSMIVVVCMCMNMLNIFYSGINDLLVKAGIKDFQIVNYTVTGKISLLSLKMTEKDVFEALAVAAVFVVVMVAVSCTVFEKRDIT